MTVNGQDVATQPGQHTGFNAVEYKRQMGVQRTSIKKGVTTGMKLYQPSKKNDDINLDLTMQVDANEEMAREERKMRPDFDDPDDELLASSDAPFHDGIVSSPNTNIERREPLQSRMIGEIQQFNMIMQSNKDAMDKRFPHKSQRSGRGIGMHLRQ